MSATNFVDGITVILAAFMNDVNSAVYTNLGDGSSYTGNLTVGSSKFTIAAASGNAIGAGDFNLTDGAVGVIDSANENVVAIFPTHSSFSNTAFSVSTTRAANSAFNFLSFKANSVAQFTFRGDSRFIISAPTNPVNEWLWNDGTARDILLEGTGSIIRLFASAPATGLLQSWDTTTGAAIIPNTLSVGGNFTLSTYGGGGGAVSIGNADSGGAGFRLLKVPN